MTHQEAVSEGDEAPQSAARPLPIHDQTFEFRETAERLEVGKELFVREEVVVSKLIETHTEHVRGTVRRTEVEVERLSPAEPKREAAATFQPAPPAPVEGRPLPVPPIREERVQESPIAAPPARTEQPAAAPAPSEPGPGAEPDGGNVPTSWWLRFVLLTLLAIVAAFYGGQLLGTIFPGL